MDAYIDDADGRLETFRHYTPAVIRSVTDQWPRPVGAPRTVQAKLQEARRVLAAASVAYECYVLAVRAGFEASELAVKHILEWPEDSPGTLGRMLKDPRLEDLLTERQRGYLGAFVLRFRNEIVHANEQMAYSPGMAEELLLGAHRAMCDLFPD